MQSSSTLEVSTTYAVIAQIVERLVEAQKVVGAVPTRSTIWTNSTMVGATGS